MAMLDRTKIISRLRMTADIFQALLAGVSEEQAHALRDGDGWNLVEIMAHMRDIEDIFFERARNMIEQDNPTHTVVDPDAMAAEHDYNARDLGTMVAEFEAARTRFIVYLEGLSDEQMQRIGTHPDSGVHTLLDLSINTVLHDVAHIHQVLKARGQI